MKKGKKEKDEKDLSIGDLAVRIDSRLQFLEVTFWNMGGDTERELSMDELSNAVSFFIEDIRKDVQELYDFEPTGEVSKA